MRGYDEKKKEIIETAGKLFSNLGYENTSMCKIAKALGSGKASLYYYFHSKEELYVNILEAEGAEYSRELEMKVMHEGDSIERLKHFLLIPLGIFEKHDNIILKMLFNIQKNRVGRTGKYIREISEKFFKQFRKLLNDGIAEGKINPELDIERFMRVFFTMMNSLFFLRQRSDREHNFAEDKKDYNLMLETMINGIRK